MTSPNAHRSTGGVQPIERLFRVITFECTVTILESVHDRITDVKNQN